MMETFEFGGSGRKQIVMSALERWFIIFLLLTTACSNTTKPGIAPRLSPSKQVIEFGETVAQEEIPVFTLSPKITVASLSSTMIATPDEMNPTPPPKITESSTSLAAISIENANSIDQIHTIEFSPWDLVTAVAWSPDGRYLAVSAGNFINIYGVAKWDRQNTIKLPAFTTSMAYSNDGRWFASGSRDGRVRIWELQNYAYLDETDSLPALTIEAHKKGVNIVRFSPEGNWIASGGNDAVVRIWSIPVGDLLGEIVGGTFAVPSMAITPDGETIAIVSGSVIRLRDAATQSISGTFLSESSLYSIAISPKGDILASGDNENTIRFWNLEDAFRTGKEDYPLAIELYGHIGKLGSYQALIWQLSFSKDGYLLASVGGDGTVRFWNAESGELLNTLDEHQAGVTSISFNPNGTMLVSGGLDGVLRIWGIDR